MSPDKREDEEIQRLRWQCRRGMLELDLLLNGFLDIDYSSMNEKEKSNFLRLLSYQDQIIHDWLMGQAVPVDGGMRELVHRIQDAARR